MFTQNLAHLRKEKRLTQEALAKQIGLTRSTYADYENGKSDPPLKVLVKLSEYFHLSIDELAGDNLMPILFKQHKQAAKLLQNDIRVLPITVNQKQQENIQYVPTAAIAGYAQEYSHPEFIEQLPHFRLPKLPEGTYRAFDVSGDSMPPIHDGYVIIGRYVAYATELKDGGRYILVTNSGGVVFKRITRDKRKSSQLILSSDNPSFLPYSVDLTDILEAWEMVAFIGFPSVYQDRTHVINERLQRIENKLDHLTI